MKNKLPTLVSPIAPDLRQFLNRMREAFESPEGLLTRDDLIGTGVFQANTTGGLDFLEPGEAESCIAPPEAVNLVAAGAMTSVILTWDNEPYASTPCYAYAEVWRASSDNLGSSVLIGTTSSSVYADAVGSDASNYYWIRFVNVLNDKGPFATSGVLGATAADLAYVFSQLTEAYGTGSAAPFFQLDSDTTINGVVISAGTYIKEAKIYNGTITNAKIGALAVDDAKIANLAVKTAKIDDLAVSTAKIANLAVTNAQINDLNAAKIDVGTLAADRIGAGTIDATKLKITGTGAIVASSIGALGSFYQDNIPTSLAIGDLWVDTDDNNKLYRAASVGADAITAGEWVTVQDGTIATAQAAAVAAQGTATSAATAATAAQDELDDIADDEKISPAEKLQALQLWGTIQSEYSGIVAAAADAGASSTAYANKYVQLSGYIQTTIAVFSNMATSTTVTRSDWDTKWKDYYIAKQALLDAIAAALKDISDTIEGNVYYSGTTEIDGGKIRADTVTVNEVNLTPSDIGVGTASGDDSMRITSTKIEIYNGGVLRVKLGAL
jgi:hypothetical protein